MTNEANPKASPAPRPRERGERGSAMIIALMVMIILTLLGVTFLVLAEQEQQIAVNERDLMQALYVAEAGVEIAKTWFNKPDPAQNPFKPLAGDMQFGLREGHTFVGDDYQNEDERTAPQDNLDGIAYAGGGGGLPFEKPYRGDRDVQLHGRRDSPDVLVCQEGEEVDLDEDGDDDCVSGATGFMADLNAAVLSMPSGEHSTRDFGEVSVQQIRVYRPPLDYDLGVRYGIATIEAISVKKVRGGRVVTQRAVRDVIQEVPFPKPGGAIETEADVGQSGSFGVHWGSVISSPFDDATDNINLPGYNNNFPQAAVPRDTPQRWGFHHTINPASGNHIGGAGNNSQAFTALTELVGRTKNGAVVNNNWAAPKIGDPWLLFRARNVITHGGNDIGGGAQPRPYNALTGTIEGNNAGNTRFDHHAQPNHSHMFQRQIVRFPPMDYETWKEVVRSGQEGMFYFSYVPGSDPPEWRLNGAGDGESFSYWVNRVRPGNLGPGVFFFDTVDSIAPYDDDDDGIADNLTPGFRFEKVGADEAYMEGFGLAYSEFLNSKGVGNGLPVHVNMPGEPFLDDGLDLNDGDGDGDECICIRLDSAKDCVLGLAPIDWGRPGNRRERGPEAVNARCTALKLDEVNAGPQDVRVAEAATFRNGTWDADLNNDGEPDGRIDDTTPGWSTFVGTPNTEGTVGHAFEDGRIPHYPLNRALEAGRFPNDRHRDPRFLSNQTIFGGGARQVHEPFLNFDYPADGSVPPPGWQATAWQNGPRVDYDAEGDANGCEYSAASQDRECQTVTSTTTISRDQRGGLMSLDLNVNGVLYCDGYYTGTGNVKVYGSLMMRGGFDGSSAVDVWFNEELADGAFPPAEWELPRIYTSARDTD